MYFVKEVTTLDVMREKVWMKIGNYDVSCEVHLHLLVKKRKVGIGI